MVYEIVQKQSGKISVESRPGFTQFSIKFPVQAQTNQTSKELRAAA